MSRYLREQLSQSLLVRNIQSPVCLSLFVLFTALWIIESYIRHKSILGRNKTFLVSSQTGRSENIKRRIVGQNRNFPNLKVVAVERLTVKEGMAPSNNIFESLDNLKPGAPQLRQQLQWHSNYQFNQHDLEDVRKDLLLRVAFSIQRLSDTISELYHSNGTTRLSIPALLKNCSRPETDTENTQNLCTPSSTDLVNEFEMTFLSSETTDYESVSYQVLSARAH